LDLPTGYYLVNFTKILDSVGELHADLLSETERAWEIAFRAAPLDGQRLYVRLISRKGPSFRSDKLAYPEIGDIGSAAAQLEQAGLLRIGIDSVDESILALTARAELDALAREVGIPTKGLKKPELIATLLETVEERRLADAITQRFMVYTPLQTENLRVYRLLFFGNLYQDLSEFVISDLGLVRYEGYRLDKTLRLFDSRASVTHALRLSDLNAASHLAEETGDPELMTAVVAVLEDPGEHVALRRRHDKILNRAGRFWERRGELDKAAVCYHNAEAPPARERRMRILERTGDLEAALALCDGIAANPRDEEERELALRFRPKLAKKLGLDHVPFRRKSHPTLDLVLDHDPSRRVETAVLEHFAAREVPGFYAENFFWLGMFGLLFWDIIFAPVKGAFFNRYQRGPLDFFEAGFRQARRDMIDERLTEIREDGAARRIAETYEAKQGIACHLVTWRYLSRENLALACERVPAEHLAAIMDRISQNPGAHKTGLPDLAIFPENGYQLLEVKGPGDQLQNNQRRWLRYFADHDIHYAVARVTWRVA